MTPKSRVNRAYFRVIPNRLKTTVRHDILTVRSKTSRVGVPNGAPLKRGAFSFLGEKRTFVSYLILDYFIVLVVTTFVFSEKCP